MIVRIIIDIFIILLQTDMDTEITQQIINKLKNLTANCILFKTNNIYYAKSKMYNSSLYDQYALARYHTNNLLLCWLKISKIEIFDITPIEDVFYFVDKDSLTNTIKKLSLFVLSLIDYNSLTSMLNRDIVNTILSYYKPLTIF